MPSSLYHKRHISNEYGTVCLPFSLHSGNYTTFYIFKEATTTDGKVSLMFESVDEVPAGTPVLFHVKERDYIDVSLWLDDEIVDAPVDPSAQSDWSLYGTFGQKVFSGEEAKCIYYISDCKIKHANKTTIAPFRAYIVGPSIDDLQSSSARISIMLDDEEVSALQLVIDDLDPCQQSAKSYTLFGTEAGEDYRGIVVRGGKKEMLR